jgi:hypothetical protein
LREVHHVRSDVGSLSTSLLGGASFPVLRKAGIIDSVAYVKGEKPAGELDVVTVPWHQYSHVCNPNSDLDDIIACSEDLVLRFVRSLPQVKATRGEAVECPMEEDVYGFVKTGPVNVRVYSEPELSVCVSAPERSNLLYAYCYRPDEGVAVLDQVLDPEPVYQTLPPKPKRKGNNCLALTLNFSYNSETGECRFSSPEET